MSDQLDELESLLKQQLSDLQRSYQKAADPIIKNLIGIDSLRPPAPLFIPMLATGVGVEVHFPKPASDVCAEKALARLTELRNLMGYVQDGSSTSVTLYQDDATLEYVIKIGKRSYYGASFEETINAAIAANKEQP